MSEERIVGACLVAIIVAIVFLLVVVMPLDMYYNNAASNRCKVAGFDKGYAPGTISHESICVTEGTDNLYTLLE